MTTRSVDIHPSRVVVAHHLCAFPRTRGPFVLSCYRLFTCGCRRASELRQVAVVALLIAGIVQKERAVVLAGCPPSELP